MIFINKQIRFCLKNKIDNSQFWLFFQVTKSLFFDTECSIEL
jgi:hypothetical protein